MKLLIKFPTRQRPQKFFAALDKYIEFAKDLKNTGFLITLDSDDLSMNNKQIVDKLESYKKQIKIAYFFGDSKTKIQAANADVKKVIGWDVLLLASDDMIPVADGYDEVIRSDMKQHFSDTDGVLWYSDGGQDRINTLCILGKKYYERFNYIYNPEYISLWCDNEFTDVSVALKKVYRTEKVIIEHQHPAWQKSNSDLLYARNDQYMKIDGATYQRRRLNNFSNIL